MLIIKHKGNTDRTSVEKAFDPQEITETPMMLDTLKGSTPMMLDTLKEQILENTTQSDPLCSLQSISSD